MKIKKSALIIFLSVLALTLPSACKGHGKDKGIQSPAGVQTQTADAGITAKKENTADNGNVSYGGKAPEKPEKTGGPQKPEKNGKPKKTEKPENEKKNAYAPSPSVKADNKIDKDGEYYKKDDVALYIHTYGRLPSNFITKKEAKKLGWSGGSLEKAAPGKSIGGDIFGNYEGRLPEKNGRTYRECDIDTRGSPKRGTKRIVYSDDGLIYYTDDHYKTFELLYGSR